jgi:hypothetical protein
MDVKRGGNRRGMRATANSGYKPPGREEVIG